MERLDKTQSVLPTSGPKPPRTRTLKNSNQSLVPLCFMLLPSYFKAKLQAQGFNPGNPHHERHALKALPRSALLGKHPVRRVGGAEGAPDRMSKEAGSGVRWSKLQHIPIAHSDFCAAIGASFIWYPHLSPFQGETLHWTIPRVKTLG